jgi:hypothetical protein
MSIFRKEVEAEVVHMLAALDPELIVVEEIVAEEVSDIDYIGEIITDADYIS